MATKISTYRNNQRLWCQIDKHKFQWLNHKLHFHYRVGFHQDMICLKINNLSNLLYDLEKLSPETATLWYNRLMIFKRWLLLYCRMMPEVILFFIYLVDVLFMLFRRSNFQQMLNNFVNFELLFTKLSGIHPYEKCIK